MNELQWIEDINVDTVELTFIIGNKYYMNKLLLPNVSSNVSSTMTYIRKDTMGFYVFGRMGYSEDYIRTRLEKTNQTFIDLIE